MNTKKPNANEGGQDFQNPHNAETAGRSLLQSLEPSLWNSKIGRRAFVKRTGAATIGTAIALHGFRMEVMAGFSSFDAGPEYRMIHAKFEHQFTKDLADYPNSEDDQTWIAAKVSSVEQSMDTTGHFARPYEGNYEETIHGRWYAHSVTLVSHWRKVTVTIDYIGPLNEGTGKKTVKYTVTIENWWAWGDETGPIDENGCPVADPGIDLGFNFQEPPYLYPNGEHGDF